MAAIVEGPLIAALSCGKPVYLVSFCMDMTATVRLLSITRSTGRPPCPRLSFLLRTWLARDGVPSGGNVRHSGH